MTTAADLACTEGKRRRLYLQIDGFAPKLWQDDGTGTAPNSDDLVCLLPPQEFSTSIDLGEMSQDLSAMTFDLLDIKTGDVSTFGSLFAPAYWDSAGHWRLAWGSTDQKTISPSQTEINIENPDGVAVGKVYLGRETLNVESVSVNTLTVRRGLDPCTAASEWGYAYRTPTSTGGKIIQQVSRYPFTFMGRRVALYICTWNESTELWNAGVLMWVGRLSEAVTYSPAKSLWSLSATSILQDLEMQVGRDFPETALENVINLRGNKGRTFRIAAACITGGSPTSYEGYCTIPDGAYVTPKYDPKSQVGKGQNAGPVVNPSSDDIIAALNKAKVSATASWPASVGMHFEVGADGVVNWVTNQSGYDYVDFSLWPWDEISDPVEPWPCHALGACGFAMDESIGTRVKDDEEAVAAGKTSPALMWHPIHEQINGGWIYLQDPDNLWRNQGDNPTVMSHIAIDGKGEAGKAAIFHCTLLTWPSDTGDPACTLRPDGPNRAFRVTDKHARVATLTEDEEGPRVRNVYAPSIYGVNNVWRGPFECLLYPLLSTGGTAYNHATYDCLVYDLCCGVEAALVDVQSFLDADKSVASSSLAQRQNYIISEPVSFKELLGRECKLFGKALVWRNGKLTIRDMTWPAIDSWTVELGDSNKAISNEMPVVTQSIESVVNQWEVKANFNPSTGKYGSPYIITDVDSADSLPVKRVTIEHPGVSTGMTADALKDALVSLLCGRMLRFPSQVMDVSMAPHLINKVFAGDVVKVTSSQLYDASGTGLKSATNYALVIQSSWNYRTHTGKAKLLLLNRYASYGTPWGPAVLLNSNHATNGYNRQTEVCHVINVFYGEAGDPDDGSAFQAGDKVILVGCDPYNSWDESSLVMGPYEVSAPYEANGVDTIWLKGSNASMGAISNRGEYVVLFADYSEAPANQITRGTWQAESSNRYLGTSTAAYRWG